jgi:alkylation response protein AidB-like acyl-CoA dehydrogenase
MQTKDCIVAHSSETLQQRLKEAEELFFQGPQAEGFAHGLFFGQFRSDAIMPYPALSLAERQAGDAAVAEAREFLNKHVDAAAIDRNAEIPLELIRGLGRAGILGATVPARYGGRNLSQQNYCRVMELLGGHCAATAVFVNAHHSIGLRALALFGTEAQKRAWLAPLASGEKVAAFALTEPEAGSDAANVQTTATPTADGAGFILQGQKRYITNGSIAQVLTVMARTPDPADPAGKITAFLVTPELPGFEVVEARMPKCGIRGTATARLAFHNMRVPRENVLGPLGKGLRVALTVLDFGRVTFGASCTGAARFCLERAVEHSRNRRQFGQPLSRFELVRDKLARAAAHLFAMEAATYHTAALIDRGADDFMLETAMLKVFASEALWVIVNDALQIHGGAGYFSDQPFERMMRDARINMIGEGANDVLRCFIAAVGLKRLGEQMLEVRRRPWKIGQLRRPRPQIAVVHGRLQPAVARLSRQIARFSRACQLALFTHREQIVHKQQVLARLGDTALELFLSSCVYSRLCAMLTHGDHEEQTLARNLHAGLLYLRLAARRNDQRLADLRENDDEEIERAAGALLGEPH